MIRFLSYCWNWFFSQGLSYIYSLDKSCHDTNYSVITNENHLAKLRTMVSCDDKCVNLPSSDKACNNRMLNLSKLNYPITIDSKCDRSNIYSKKTIKVINWNIHGGFDASYKYTLMDQCEYLSNINADIVCLQEVNNTIHIISSLDDNNTHDWPNGVNQSIFIARYCKYPYYVQYHNMAILSKFPIIHTHHIHDNAWHMGYGSHVIVADILLDPSDNDDKSRTLSIYNCHLNNDLVGYEQWHFVSNTSLISELLALSYNRLPLIICGDFNSLSWYSALKKIRATLCYLSKHEIWTRNRPTYPVMYPLLKLDRIYTNQNTHNGSIIKFSNNYVDYKCKFSDHYPLISFFEIL